DRVDHACSRVEHRVAAHLEQAHDRGADAVPAGNDVAVLRPGKYPRDGAEVAQGFGTEAPRRTRTDIEHRDLIEWARRLEIGDEVWMTHEPRIGRAGGAREGFERILELALWTKMLLALGLERRDQ